jgi:hypothetical protein
MVLRVKEFLFESISSEQSGFFSGRQIHDAISMAQERMHTIKTKNMLFVVPKLHLYIALGWCFDYFFQWPNPFCIRHYIFYALI